MPAGEKKRVRKQKKAAGKEPVSRPARTPSSAKRAPRRVAHPEARGTMASALNPQQRDRVSNVGASMNGPGKSAFLQATLPYDSPLVRVRPHGASCSLQSTALSRNFLTVDLDLNALANMTADRPTVQTSGGLTAGSVPLWGDPKNVAVIALHDPLVLGFYPVVATAPSVYQSQYTVGEQSYDGVKYVTAGCTVVGGVTIGHFGHFDGNTAVAFSPLKFISLSGGFYGTEFYAFTRAGSRNLRYFWVDASVAKPAVIVSTVTPDAPGSIGLDTCTINVVRVMRDELITEASEAMPAAAAGAPSVVTINLTQSGFYAIIMEGFLSTGPGLQVKMPYSWTVEVEMQTSLACRQLINEHLLGSSNQVERTQVNGTAMLIQNTQAALAKGGVVYAVSVGEDDAYWPDYTSDPKNRVMSTNSNTRYQGSWEHGVYGFCKPVRTYVSKDTFRLHPGDIYENLTDPLDVDGMNVFIIEALPAATYPPRATITVCVAYEFTTRSQMFVKSYSQITQTDLGKLIELLQTQFPFTENPFHWQGFLDAIRGGARKVMEWAPKIASGVGTAANLASGIAGLVSAV